MFSLTIVFGPGPMVWTLMFKTIEGMQAAAAKCQNNAPTELFNVTDDFGQDASINSTQIHGMMAEDLDQSKFAHIERALHQARTKVTADKLAESDPTIREAQRRAQGGMPMIQPAMQGFGPNGRFPS
jgi:hypothetical protein